MSEWQPIETAPKGGENILIGAYVGHLFYAQSSFHITETMWAGWHRRRRPTHWMPLPEPPEEE